MSEAIKCRACPKTFIRNRTAGKLQVYCTYRCRKEHKRRLRNKGHGKANCKLCQCVFDKQSNVHMYCHDCKLTIDRERSREYRRNNREDIKRKKSGYWQKHRERLLLSRREKYNTDAQYRENLLRLQKESRSKHATRHRRYNKSWEKNNPLKRRAIVRRYQSKPEVIAKRRESENKRRAANRDRENAYQRNWRAENPDKNLEYHRRLLKHQKKKRDRERKEREALRAFVRIAQIKTITRKEVAQ